MTLFLLGFVIGGCLGFWLAALMAAAKDDR